MTLIRILRTVQSPGLMSLCALVFAVIFCCAGQLTAQMREPDIRILIDDMDAPFQGPPSLQFSASGDYLLVVGHQPSHVLMRRFDLSLRRFDLQLSFPSDDVMDSTAISSNGTRLALIDSKTPAVQVLDFASGDVLYAFPYPSAADVSLLKSTFFPPEIAFSADDMCLVIEETHIGYGNLYIADIESGVWHPFQIGSGGAFSLSNSGRLAIAEDKPFVDSFVVESRASCMSDPETRKTFDGSLFHDDLLSLSSDGERLLLGMSRRNNADEFEDVWYVLDAQTLTPLDEPWIAPRTDSRHLGEDGAWLGDRPIVVSFGADNIAVFDVRERNVLFSRSFRDFSFSKVALSPDGRWLAISQHEGLGEILIEVYALDGLSAAKSTVQIPASTERVLPRLVPQLSHLGPGLAVSVSEDGRVVAVSGSDGWVSLWERTSGRLFRRLRFDPGEPTQVVLSRDGSQLLTSGSIAAVWDVASGELLQHFGLWVPYNFSTFLANDTLILLCNIPHDCVLRNSPSNTSTEPITRLDLQQLGEGLDEGFFLADWSLAPDEASVALALGGEGVGWMELSTDGRQRIIPVPDEVEVTAVAALGDTQVVAGLSNGDVLLIDAAQGETLRTLRTRETKVGALVHLDDTRLAVASYGQAFLGKPDDPKGEILIVSLKDFSMLQRLTWNRPMGDENQPSSAYIDRLAASGDGRWLVSVSSPGIQDSPFIQVWDTAAAQAAPVLGGNSLAARYGAKLFENEELLVDNGGILSRWDLKKGRATQEPFFDYELARLARDSGGLPLLFDSVLARLAQGVHDSGALLVFERPDKMDLVLISLDERGKEERTYSIEVPVWPNVFHLNAAADRILLDHDRGIEMLSASSGESIWLRDDMRLSIFSDEMKLTMTQATGMGLGEQRLSIFRGEMRLTADHTGVVVRTDDYKWCVLEAATGETRFTVDSPLLPRTESVVASVIDNTVVQGLLRVTDDSRVERLSLRDGSVIDSTNLGMTLQSLAFAASDRSGNVYLLAQAKGRVALWDTTSGERMTFEAEPAGPEDVAFSPDGRLLAIAETDGTVSLWDVSSGPTGLRHLARLIMFDDGGWAVVAEDGRYDASDPADLDGLAWVMPDAPTKPVPLSIFYREYYEPRLLPRLLAGEVFPPITSIADLDRAQPQVKIATVEPTGTSRVNVTVEVERAGAEGVHDLKLFRDGSLVELDERAGQTGSGTGNTWRVTFRDIALPTSGGESVEFSAYAFNADGVKSDTHRLRYTLPEVEPNPRRAFVIAVGVNAYQNPSWDLRYAAEDARATGDIVARHLEASGTFEEVHTVSLITERGASGAIAGTATRAALLAVLDVLAGEDGDRELLNTIPGAASLSKTRPDDLVYLAFSGHGLSGDKGLFHLFLSDIGEGEGRTVNSALLARTLDSDLLARHLRRVDAGDFVMVIDACNSAASVEGGGFKPGPMGSRGLGQLAYDKAMRVLAASQAEAVALESDQLRHGLLTFAMLHEGLAGGAADRAPMDRAIGFSEMLNYGVERVPLLYEDISNGSFASQGRGLTAFKPIAQPASPPAQRPSLFDFSRSERDVRLPVMDQDE